MSALIYDNSASAFKEAENPKINVNGTFVDSNGMVHKDDVWKEVYSAKIPGTQAVTTGRAYILDGAYYNGSQLTGMCLSITGTNAIIQLRRAAGEGTWPGGTDLKSRLRSSWGNLYDAINHAYLPTGTNQSDFYPSGGYWEVYYSLGIAPNGHYGVWLGNSSGGNYYYMGSKYNGEYIKTTNLAEYVLLYTPYISIDLTKVVADPKAPTVLLAK